MPHRAAGSPVRTGHADWAGDAGPAQPQCPLGFLLLERYCWWLSYTRAMPAGVPGGMGPAAGKPISALGREDAHVLGCPTGQHERGLSWYQPIAAALSDGGRGVRSTDERPFTGAPSRPQEMTQMEHPEPVARRLYELTEPISLVNFFSPEPNDSMAALGFGNYWDGYFAGRSAPLGRAPAEVVHAAFYDFADGEMARHIPKVWDTTTPEAAHAAREQGCVAALRRILGDLAGTPGLARAAELLDQRPGRGTGHVRRAPRPPHAPGARGPALARGQHAARAPRGRPHRWPGLRADRRDAGPRAQCPGHGHLSGGVVRPDPPPPPGPPGRGHGRPARPRPPRRLRPLHRRRACDQDPDRVTDRRPRRSSVRRTGAAGARAADRSARAHLQKARGHGVAVGRCGLTAGQRRPALLRAGSPRTSCHTPTRAAHPAALPDLCLCL